MLTDRHQFWLASLPRQPEALWDSLSQLVHPERQSLFAHCVGLSVNAAHEAYNRRPRALAHADVLAGAVELDMVAAGWTPTVDSYLGRVTKARILQAVREAKGDDAAERIAHLKKGEMAEKAEALLAGSGWLPEKLRRQGQVFAVAVNVEAPGTEPEAGLSDDPEHEADMSTEVWPVAAE